MPSRAQAADGEELARLYRRNHPGIPGTFKPEVEYQSQTFVVRGKEGIIGLALVGCISYGLHRHGMVYELEVAQGADNYGVGRSLIDACLSWLTELGASRLWVAPATDQECARFGHLGFRQGAAPGMFRLVPVQMARQVSA